MDSQKIEELIKLNSDFYKTIQTDFSKTRQSAWRGWETIVKTITQNFTQTKNISVLDIGCGNGRFYEFLNKKLPIKYTGVDNNEYMLNEAKTKFPDGKWELLDIFNNLESIENKFNLVVVFGITHHLPGKSFRENWFNQLNKLVNNNGILVLTFWNVLEQNSIKAENLEENDYFVGWNNLENVHRYCHHYDEKELKEIKSNMVKNNFKLLKEFENDGKDNKSNKYLVFQKHA